MKKSKSFMAIASLAVGLGVSLVFADPTQNAASESPSSVADSKSKTVYKSDKEVKPLQPGAKVPEATVKNAAGEDVNLKDTITGTKTVLVFYRGGWCPYCNTHLGELAEIEPVLLESGYQIIGLSPDSPEKVAQETKNRTLPRTILSDHAFDAMKSFGVAYEVSDEINDRLKGYKIDINEWSGKTERVLPVPAVFVIDEAGEIVFTHANADYRVRMDKAGILKAAGVEADKKAK